MASKIESATSWMINIANDNSYGYLFGGWGPKDYDCGHAIITAWEQAGVPLKSRGATYTGNMYDAARACGFRDVTGTCNLVLGTGMKRGDILLNRADHAAMYIGNGQLVHARSSEGNSISGDQSGNEIRIQSYFNYPWTDVLRYEESAVSVDETDDDSTIYIDSSVSAPTKSIVYMSTPFPIIQPWMRDTYYEFVESMQSILNTKEGYSLTEDGHYGPLSQKAVKKWQEEHPSCGSPGQTKEQRADMEVGALTWKSIIMEK